MSDIKSLNGYPLKDAQARADLNTHATDTTKHVTAAEKATWSGKQDAITDLTTIREDAAAGATAAQSVNNKTGKHITLTPADIGLGAVFTLKGAVATVSNLPSSGNTIGDVYYVKAESVGYIWLNDGTTQRWEQLGLSIDLSEYAKAVDLLEHIEDTTAHPTDAQKSAWSAKQDAITDLSEIRSNAQDGADAKDWITASDTVLFEVEADGETESFYVVTVSAAPV